MTALRGRPIGQLGRVFTIVLFALTRVSSAYDLDPDSEDSVKTIARSIAEDTMEIYRGDEPGQTPGLLPDPPYYWWEAGALMGTMIDYWYYTGDDTWNDKVVQALMHQVGEFNDYMPDNQTLTEGNDDQGFWGLAVMSAAEQRFPDPPEDQPGYLGLAQAVFNTQAARWDPGHCGGGLRWQIFNWNKGFDYKNTISQGCFFALAARLALYTGNSSYADWAEKTWDWTKAVGFIDDNYSVFDGAHIPTNCTNIVPYQWSYNVGVFINGASAMYNLTGSDEWKERLDSLVNATDVFFVGDNRDIMQEVACETVELCNNDQQSFKTYLTRWLAATTKWAPHLTDYIMPKLRASSIAAASTCVGGDNGRMCGLKWTEQGKWDGLQGVGPQMMAMQAALSNIVASRPDPVTASSGGTSTGDAAGGGEDIGRSEPGSNRTTPIKGGDKAGAAIVTIILVVALIAGFFWLLRDETSDKTIKERFFDFRSALAGGAGLMTLVHRRNRDDVDEKSGPIDQRSGSDLDSSRNSEVPTPVPMQKGLTNSRRALDDGAIGDKFANVIQREMSGGSGSGGSGWATPVSEAGQRDSNRLSRKSMLSSTIN
ncbi:Mannan endo-1 like protein [Verticillium longisporum]|uniref:mannan endo-1,6-alpha-mannosidase n=1 Tax=Verticillium longisporum TaxID=100787 RepID=A0A8I2ZUS4_VERLO|nr:Mannan endo-1 like protein [Verticillium longisporum]